MKTKDLNPGHIVIVHYGSCWENPDVEAVERVTATQIILSSGRKFRKTEYETARQVGEHSRTSISIPEPGEIEKIMDAKRAQTLGYELYKVKWASFPPRKLELIISIIQRVCE